MLLKTKELGVNMLKFVQFPTHLSHITLLQPFQIKCERYIFRKKCVRSSSLLILLPHVSVHATILHLCRLCLFHDKTVYFLHNFIFTLWTTGTAKSTRQVLSFPPFFVYLFKIWSYENLMHHISLCIGEFYASNFLG